ncbi:hypothetical protein Tco_1002279 [Tanacetum coccineum]|uniref:Uncharacterized protein n=1 Tax=Tanacetum coccineum TaxID=301880 RepID=A0ABQ5F5S8_9ASTR
MPELMRDVLYARMLMEHRDDDRVVRDISTDGDFLGPPPSYALIRDLVLRLCHRMMSHSIAGRSQAPKKRFAAGRKSGAFISYGQFVARLAEHFRLLTEERLQGWTVTAPTHPIIDMAKLVRLHIYVNFGDTWAWVPAGPARQEVDARGVAEEAPVALGGGDEDEEMP